MNPHVPTSAPKVAEFAQSWAFIIGIDDYANGVPVLHGAVADARLIGATLRDYHGYQLHLLDAGVTRAMLLDMLTRVLPATVGPDDRLLVYFAGHGLARDDDQGEGPAGYLLPQDAQRDDPIAATYLSMRTLYQALAVLPCRHLLLILDCCFAGSFRWSARRGSAVGFNHLYPPRYARFLREPAWQVITSAAYNQTAADLVVGLGTRNESRGHYPFAWALHEALAAGTGDLSRPSDYVMTATELYSYLRDQLEASASGAGQQQSPGLWLLPRHRSGEYIFLVPGHTPVLPATPTLTPDHNPYRGLEPYGPKHRSLFFGRDRLIHDLSVLVGQQPLTVVLGPSGSGKSSLVGAGLIPQLTSSGWHILPSIRPGLAPLASLQTLLATYDGSRLPTA